MQGLGEDLLALAVAVDVGDVDEVDAALRTPDGRDESPRRGPRTPEVFRAPDTRIAPKAIRRTVRSPMVTVPFVSSSRCRTRSTIVTSSMSSLGVFATSGERRWQVALPRGLTETGSVLVEHEAGAHPIIDRGVVLGEVGVARRKGARNVAASKS